ncbi:MAG: septum site-determining protein MinD [Clostridia bacterium]
MGRRIVITSGKGGVGKTTIVANLGLQLAASGARVALVDADIGLNNLDVALGMEHKTVYDIGDIADGKCRLKQALIRDEHLHNLYLLPSAKVNGARVTTQIFSSIVNELAEGFEFVLIDCPAGIESGFHRAVIAAHEAITVTTPHISAVRDADKVLSLLSTYNIESVALAVNRVRGDLSVKGSMMGAEEIAHLLRVPLCAALPEDDGISVFGIADYNKKDKTNRAYKLFADYIVNGGGRVYNCERNYKGFFYKLKNRED